MNNLEVVYRDVIAVLRGVSLEVPAGAVVALLGPNGAGKTTLLRALSGLLSLHRGRITKGSVTLDGQPIAHLEAPAVVRRGVSQVMERRRIFSELTVEENLRAGGHCRPGRAERAASMERVMELFPVLAARRSSTAGYLSGGEQQMLAMGRALMASPRLLLLDEPSLGLAPRAVQQIASIVVDINSQGTSVLIVEQNASMALSVASRGFVLNQGRIVIEGPAARLMDDPEVRHSYLGRERTAPTWSASPPRRQKRWSG